MPQITVKDLRIGFRGPPLLDDVSCQIELGQRIGLLGRNGEGKTTFMRVLSGEIDPDHGTVQLAAGTLVSLLPQDVPLSLSGPVKEIVMSGGPKAAQEPELRWKLEQSARQLLQNMDLPADAPLESLSSGMKRRVLLARALVAAPDVLLLDEPTNHLDLDAITWLEDYLSRWRGTLIFVTHDRMFLRKLATRILEIDRGRLFDWSCDYETFLLRKEGVLAAEEKQNALFDRKLAEEEVWIRTGIRARRTRNEGRVRALEAMRQQRSERRSTVGRTQLTITEGQRSGLMVAEAKHVTFQYGERTIFKDFSTSILRGDKIGIIGPNGSGKTTLLKVLLGQLTAQQGKVRVGANLQIAYFDQLRQQLNPELTVQENVGDGYETVQVNGQPRHIIGYLQDFLFSRERVRTQVKFLSGGERNRILLAKLFAKPANVIVLDEPTNDLDAETLELLESRLVEFDGTVLLVSHDRAFLNNVVTSTIVFENGGVKEYDGGYDDWLRQRVPAVAEPAKAKPAIASQKTESNGGADKQRRATYKERQERAALPGRIEELETQIEQLHTEMAAPAFYQQAREQITAAAAQLKQLEDELGTAYARWEELDLLSE